MVAYSFAPQFADAVAALTKCQTVRADRKRHARPGEPIQLYAGMRTRQCRKLVQRDPVCVDVRRVEIGFSRTVGQVTIASIEIEGVPLSDSEIEAFAAQDGFGPADGRARGRMARFWVDRHGSEPFFGVVIRWVGLRDA